MGTKIFVGSALVLASVVIVGVSEGGARPSDPEGCAGYTEVLNESKEFTPWGERLSHPVGIDVDPVVEDVVNGEVLPASIGSLRLAGAIEESTRVVGLYAESDVSGQRISDALRGGAVSLAIGQTDASDSATLQKETLSLLGDRATPVQIGPSPGVLTWADPTAEGDRPHVVVWVADRHAYELTTLSPGASAIDLARDVACRSAVA